MTKELLRTCYFRPYRKGMGPTFALKVWDCNSVGLDGKSRLAYRLVMRDARKAHVKDLYRVIFEGEDFFCAPHIAIDSDHMVESLMSFLVLKPGDTDQEHFSTYTDWQMQFCVDHAESLSLCVYDRFSKDAK